MNRTFGKGSPKKTRGNDSKCQKKEYKTININTNLISPMLKRKDVYAQRTEV